MSNDKLRRVTDLQRELLAALDETPAEHQAQVQARKVKAKLRAFRTTESHSTQEPVWKLNRQTLNKLSATTPLHELPVIKNQDIQTLYDWKPEAYVIFVHRIFCKHCRSWSDSLAQPQCFLKQRRLTRDASQSRLYTPVKERSLKLPSLRELQITTCEFCLTCFERRNGLDASPRSGGTANAADVDRILSEPAAPAPHTHPLVIAGPLRVGII